MNLKIKLAYILMLKHELSPRRYKRFQETDDIVDIDSMILATVISAQIKSQTYGFDVKDIMEFLDEYAR